MPEEFHVTLRKSKMAMEHPSFLVDFPIKAFIYTGFPKIMEDVPRAFFQIHIFTSADRGSRFLARTSPAVFGAQVMSQQALHWLWDIVTGSTSR